MRIDRLAVFTGVLFCAWVGTAFASVPDAPEFGWIGGAPGQVLRVNVMAIDSELPAWVSLVFQDVLGRQVGPAPKVILLRPGQADDFELNFTLVGKGRTYVRPVMKYLEGSGKAMITTEFYDQFLGRTATGAYVGNRFGLAGSVQFGPIGLAFGQTMLLAVGASAHGGGGGAGVDPCVATINFRKSTGEVVDPNDRVVLQPGQWTFQELNGTKLVRFGQHINFVPAVQVDGDSNSCIANVQVYDQASGLTTVYVPGSGDLNF